MKLNLEKIMARADRLYGEQSGNPIGSRQIRALAMAIVEAINEEEGSDIKKEKENENG